MFTAVRGETSCRIIVHVGVPHHAEEVTLLRSFLEGHAADWILVIGLLGLRHEGFLADVVVPLVAVGEDITLGVALLPQPVDLRPLVRY